MSPVSRAVKPLTTVASVEAACFIGPATGDPHDRTDWPDGRVPGLVLRVTRGGVKSWCLRYRSADGGSRRVTLGRYPDVSLATARDEAGDLRQGIRKGGDPSAARNARRAEAKRDKVDTIEDLMSRYLTAAARGVHRSNGRAKRASTIALDRYHIDRLIIPRLGSVPVRALSKGEVQTFLDDASAGHGVSTARHCLAALRQALNYAVRLEITAANPAALASLPRQPERERVLTADELRAFWQATSAPTPTNRAIRFAMVTLQRGGEVAGLHAGEVDREARVWMLPGDRTKNHRSHVVPLSDLALSILSDAFDSHASEEDRRAGRWSGFAFPGRSDGRGGIQRAAISRGFARISKATGIVDATPHDMRRTGATNITGERIGIPRFIVSRVLNQISDTGGAAAATRIYDRNEYLPEKRKALDAWAILLAEIVEGRQRADNVTALGRARA